ncbi:MAG: hypothetical protein KDD53_09315, partial [Bdellovibrionales bacterium]|nr:hypothetical protein [Bdellovibrionales bacterium]
HPENGQQFVNLTWAGFTGSISGMNASGITIGEKVHGDPENETLRGRPMPFLMRDVLQDAESLDQARDIIMHAPPTNSFQFLISDGKTRKAELYIKDPDRFVVFQPGEGFSDRGTSLPGLECMLYAGHFGEKMGVVLNQHASSLNPKLIETEIIPVLAMKSNFQNVIYDPEELALWVSYAQSTSTRAAEAPYVFFSLKEFI